MNYIYNKINYFFYLISRYTKILEKKVNLSFHYFSLFRIRYRNLEKKYSEIINLNNDNFLDVGNYFLYKPDFDKKLNILSAGIGKDISFDLSCLKQFNVNKLIMIDPTEVAYKTTLEITNTSTVFFIKKGLFKEIKTIKAYLPHESIEDNSNISIENLYSSTNFTHIETITISKIFKDFSMDYIDILKLDVEGVADDIILDLINKNIFPKQICFELEKPVDIFIQDKFNEKIQKFLKLLSKFYKIYSYTSIKKGYRMELLAVKI